LVVLVAGGPVDAALVAGEGAWGYAALGKGEAQILLARMAICLAVSIRTAPGFMEPWPAIDHQVFHLDLFQRRVLGREVFVDQDDDRDLVAVCPVERLERVVEDLLTGGR